MNNRYFRTNKSVTLEPEELEMIGYSLIGIEGASKACRAIANTIRFLQKDPIEETKYLTNACAIKGPIDEILQSTMGDYAKLRSENIGGFISAIDIIGDYIDTKKEDISVAIESAEREQREEKKQ